MANSIKSDIRANTYSKVYLMWGDEEFLKDYYKNALLNKVLDKTFSDFNYMKYTESKPDNDEIAGFFSSYPFMSDKKILYIKDSGLFKKANEDDKKFWLELLAELPDFAIIIFSEKELDKRNALYKAVSKSFCAEEFPYQQRADLISWVIRYISQYEKNISDTDAEYLIESCSESMYILKNELEKLAFYKPNQKFVTKEDIDKCISKIPESRVFKMIDDILAGNVKSAGEKLGELKLLKEEPILINGAIFSKYSQLRRVKVLSETMSAKQIASSTKQNPYHINIQIKQAKNISMNKLNSVMQSCHELDHRVKSGVGNPWTEIDILFSKMCE